MPQEYGIYQHIQCYEVQNRKDENGNIVSSGIDDMAPFLDKDEYDSMKYEAFCKGRI